MSDRGAAPQALLTLTQWLSPAFPLGAYAYSHGLESAVADGHVADAATLRDWIEGLLLHGSGQADAVLLVHVLLGGDPDAAAAMARALCAGAARRRETDEMGAAFARTLASMTGEARAPHPLPVALGLAARPLGLPPVTVAALYLQSFASNQVSCALRAMPLGQAAGQGVLAALAPVLDAAAEAAAHGDLDRIATCDVGASIAAMRQDSLQPKVFAT